MEHALQSAEVDFAAWSGPQGLDAEALIETATGVHALQDLRPGDHLVDRSGQRVQIVAVHVGETGHWVELPGIGDQPGHAVASDQRLLCSHFLCAALFGSRDVALRCGDLVGVQVRPSGGAMRRLVLPVTDRPCVIRLGGYDFPLDPPPVDLNITGDPCESPHGTETGPYLNIGQAGAQQLRDAGILFRRSARASLVSTVQERPARCA